MTFDIKKYKHVAVNLIMESKKNIDVQLKQAKLRTAINRLYYYTFSLCRKYKNESSTHKAHAKLIESFYKSDNEKEVKISEYLDDMRIWRVNCDYKSGNEITMNNAMECFDKCGQIEKLLTELKDKI